MTWPEAVVMCVAIVMVASFVINMFKTSKTEKALQEDFKDFEKYKTGAKIYCPVNSKILDEKGIPYKTYEELKCDSSGKLELRELTDE